MDKIYLSDIQMYRLMMNCDNITLFKIPTPNEPISLLFLRKRGFRVLVWRPGRDSDPGPAGDSRIYYSGIEERFLFVTGLYYQGYLFWPRRRSN